MKKTLLFTLTILLSLGWAQSTVSAADTTSATPTATQTAAPVTFEVTSTPIAAGPGTNTVTASLDTNCRKYPIRAARALAYLKADQSAVAIGKERTGNWYLIYDPSGEGGLPCWVWSGSTTYNGDLNKLGIVLNEYNTGLPTPVVDD